MAKSQNTALQDRSPAKVFNRNSLENATGHLLYRLIVDTIVFIITKFQSGMVKGTCDSSTQKAKATVW